MLNEQGIADVLQDCPATAKQAPFFRKLPGERLDNIEDGGDFALVAGEHNALG